MAEATADLRKSMASFGDQGKSNKQEGDPEMKG